MLVAKENSIATLARMSRPSKTLEPWQLEDAERLKALYEARKGKMSQEEFGNRFEIGSQGMRIASLFASDGDVIPSAEPVEAPRAGNPARPFSGGSEQS